MASGYINWQFEIVEKPERYLFFVSCLKDSSMSGSWIKEIIEALSQGQYIG
jgi:hypothetical protein